MCRWPRARESSDHLFDVDRPICFDSNITNLTNDAWKVAARLSLAPGVIKIISWRRLITVLHQERGNFCNRWSTSPWWNTKLLVAALSTTTATVAKSSFGVSAPSPGSCGVMWYFDQDRWLFYSAEGGVRKNLCRVTVLEVKSRLCYAHSLFQVSPCVVLASSMDKSWLKEASLWANEWRLVENTNTINWRDDPFGQNGDKKAVIFAVFSVFFFALRASVTFRYTHSRTWLLAG